MDSKAASVFDAGSSDLAINTGTFTWAITVLEKDVAVSSFQQSGVGSGIRKVNMNSNRISDGDHSTIVSSLSGDDRQGHAPRSDEAIGTLKQSRDEMSADLVDARKAEEDCKTNHAAFIAAEKRRSPVQQGRTDVINASKADEAADAGRSVFELHSVQSTAAVSCAGQAETANEESTFGS